MSSDKRTEFEKMFDQPIRDGAKMPPGQLVRVQVLKFDMVQRELVFMPAHLADGR